MNRESCILNHESCIMNREQGFTLIEVVSSLVIVGIALVAILGMFSIGSRSNAISQDRVIACNLLQRKLEEIKCMSFGTDVTESDEESYQEDYPGYTFTVTPTTPYSGNSYLKRVDVTINWTTFGGSHSETISTLIANY